MLRTILRASMLLVIAAAPVAAQDAPAPTFVYEALFRISFADMEEWNRQYREYSIPVLEEMVEDGDIAGWGQWEHNTGGTYNVRFSVRTFDWAAIDAFWSEYLERVNEAAAADGAQPTGALIQAHQDNIWNLSYADVPTEAGVGYVYEASFRINFGDEAAWNETWEGPLTTLMDESMAAGVLDGWVKLNHNTGGPHNSKILYFFEDWDEIDDFWAFFFAEFEGRYPDAAARTFTLFREHDDVIWVPTPAEPM